MAHYRCDFLDRQGKVFSSHDIEARSDPDAMAQARALSGHAPVVLWCGERKVEATDPPAIARPGDGGSVRPLVSPHGR